MTNETNTGINKQYVVVVSVLTFLLPLAFGFAETQSAENTAFTWDMFGKWFIFSAVGLRLFLAGIKQTTNPAFTAKEIFHIHDSNVFPIIRELGFANLCFGIIGIVSLWLPQWRIVSAFGSGLYYGIAGLQHIIKKPAGANEKFALLTDLIIFGVLLFYCIKSV